ncbi:type VII secretion integral membrane protein EccD [Actinoplanes sp. NPDC051343]|uniref:type VII secretion integral membrane protein EccD n=1 Tax=Actinoplanes sp. NPDC051343 TaxID=3363906 RepID=UPI00379C4564
METRGTDTSATMCRLVVWGPDRRIEIAVPASVVIADLLPVLLNHLGVNLADAGLAHGGWVLQRLGEAPLAEERTVGGEGLVDGSEVYLRPQSDQIPPVHFDDLADGLANGIAVRAGRWRPEMGRWAAAGVLGAAGLAGVPVVLAGDELAPRAAAAGLVALLGLTCAFIFARAFGDRVFALVAGGLAVLYAALIALVLPGGGALTAGAPEVFAGGVVAAMTALLVGALAGFAGPLVTAVVTGSLCCAAGAAADVYAATPAPAGAGIVLVLATVATLIVPWTAFRLAGIYLAPLPTRPEHLQEDIDPEPADDVLPRAAAADRYMTGLHAGLGVAALAGIVVAAPDTGWTFRTLLLLAAFVRLLACRPMISAWHRAALGIPAVTAIAIPCAVAALDLDPRLRPAAVAGALLIALVVCFVLGRRLPTRRAMPVWGRVGDIVQLIGTVALLPVLAAALGVYGAARAIGG